MSLTVRSGGTNRTINGGVVRINGQTRPLRSIQVQDGGVLRTLATFIADLDVTVAPDPVRGERFGSGVVTTGPTTATPEGGLAPFTYSWTRITGSGQANSPTSASSSFRRFVQTGEVAIETYRCTVTDVFGTQASDDVEVRFSSIFEGNPNQDL